MSGPDVMVAMSGGVDSSVAAAHLVAEGRRVVGVTLKLWGGDSDSGCCAVSDVDDARRVAQQLGIDHHVFNFGGDFDRHVVERYVEAHAAGRTPNPCIECNRHLKFERLLRRARALGFDRIATGHHAQVVDAPDERIDGRPVRRIARGADPAKDQSYVLYMLDQAQLAGLELPIGHLAKDEVRAEAARLGLRTADKPDSQDVCFITATGGGRRAFLDERLALTPGRVVDASGGQVGSVDAVQLVTIGQRKGLRTAGGGSPRYVTAVDVPTATVTVGSRRDLLADHTVLGDLCWAHQPVVGPVDAQVSAHGRARPARIEGSQLRWDEPHQRVAPGQSVVLYRHDQVVGGGIAA